MEDCLILFLSSLSENVQLYHHATTKQVIGTGEPRQLKHTSLRLGHCFFFSVTFSYIMTTRLNGEESLASIPGLTSETMGRCSHKDENEGKIFALNRFNFQNMNHTILYIV